MLIKITFTWRGGYAVGNNSEAKLFSIPDCPNISVLNVIGIEKRIEKCAIEATQCSSTFCKVSFC